MSDLRLYNHEDESESFWGFFSLKEKENIDLSKLMDLVFTSFLDFLRCLTSFKRPFLTQSSDIIARLSVCVCVCVNVDILPHENRNIDAKLQYSC